MNNFDKVCPSGNIMVEQEDKKTWFCYNCEQEFGMNEDCYEVDEEAYCRKCHSSYIAGAEYRAESQAENQAMEE